MTDVGPGGSQPPRRLRNGLLVALAVVMINLPFVHSVWQDHRLDQDGVDHAASLTDHEKRDGNLFVSFDLKASDDQPGISGEVRVDRAAYDDAVASGQVTVRALPGSSTVWRGGGGGARKHRPPLTGGARG